MKNKKTQEPPLPATISTISEKTNSTDNKLISSGPIWM